MGQKRPDVDLSGMYKALRYVLWPVIHGTAKTHFQGMENVPKKGPMILAPNHISEYDPLVMGYAFGLLGYQVRFLTKDSMFKVPVLRAFVKKARMIPVSRGGGDTDSLAHARKALREGAAVGIYYEGTLTRDPAFWPMKGKTGLARLALDERVPVIPVVQWGAQDVLDRYGRFHLFKKRPNLYIRALPPLDYSDIPGDSSNHDGVRELTNRVQETLTAGLAELREQVAPTQVWNMKEMGPDKRSLKNLAKWRSGLRKATGRQDVLPATPGADVTIIEVAR